MGKHLVLVGAGHAHLTTLTHLSCYKKRGHTITLITPDEYHYYSGMGPGLLGGIYRPQDIRFNVKRLAITNGARVVIGSAQKIDIKKKVITLSNKERISYDVLSVNTGSEPVQGPFPKNSDRIFTVKPIVNLYHARTNILRAAKKHPARVLVAGGGAAGVETAGNLWRIAHDAGVGINIILVSSGPILERFPYKMRAQAHESLINRGVTIIENQTLEKVGKSTATLTSGEKVPFDFAFNAIGVLPPDIFKRSGFSLGPDGEMLVNEYLQSVDCPDIFGGGDSIYFQPIPLNKAGVYAVRQNPVLFSNIESALDGDMMQVFIPQKEYMVILNMGNNEGILLKKPFIIKSSWAFRLKNFIDQNFMKKYQRMKEREEPVKIR